MSLPATFSRLVTSAVLLLCSAMLVPANAVELKGTPVPLGDDSQLVQSSAPASAVSASSLGASSEPVAPEVPQPPSLDLKSPRPQLIVTNEGSQLRLDGQEIQISDEQLENLWAQHIGPEISRALQGVDKESLSSAVLVPFIVFFFIFGCPTIIVIALLVLRHRAKSRHLQNLNSNIDKLLANGRDIPLELLRGDDPRGPEDNSGLNKGIMNIGLGLGLLIFLTVMAGFDVGALGFILIGMGASRVIIWKLSQQRPSELQHPAGQELQG